MKQFSAWILIYLFCVNLFSFCQFGIDKYRAKKGKWRISERALFLGAIAGGTIGSMVGMYLFHHKTLHRKFTVGLPMILLLQMAAAICLAHYL